MTYYSDLLIVIDEIDALKHGLAPRRSVAELRGLCGNILAIDPDEDLAAQLLFALRDLDGEIAGPSLLVLIFEKFRVLAGLSKSAH